MSKSYKYKFDPQTQEYKGITREFKPDEPYVTDIPPHFQYGFKTIFDLNFFFWKLVPQENFYEQVSVMNKLDDVVNLKNEFIVRTFMDVNNTVEKSNQKMHEKYIKYFDRIFEKQNDYESYLNEHLVLLRQLLVQQCNNITDISIADSKRVMNELQDIRAILTRPPWYLKAFEFCRELVLRLF